MFTDAEISGQIRSIAAFQVFAARRFFEASFADDDEGAEAAAREVMELTLGAGVVAESLGLDVATNDILIISDDPQQMSAYLFDRIVLDRRLPHLLEDLLGVEAAFQLDLTRTVASIALVAGILGTALPMRGAAGISDRVVNRERTAAIHRFGHSLELFKGAWRDQLLMSGEDWIARALDDVAATLAPRRWTADAFRAAQLAADRMMTLLVPHFGHVQERMSRARTIIGDLKACKAGDGDWRRYENICIAALRLLFIPPFRSLLVQRSTASRHERRDAILTNNQFSGFWNILRHDLDCRHIVCEFKNVRRLSKSDVNQIRTYLRKPTIGRFGIVFHRSPAGESARLAQHIAYADDRALILLVDDVALVRLLVTRAFTGSVDGALERLKVQFDTTY